MFMVLPTKLDKRAPKLTECLPVDIIVIVLACNAIHYRLEENRVQRILLFFLEFNVYTRKPVSGVAPLIPDSPTPTFCYRSFDSLPIFFGWMEICSNGINNAQSSSSI